MNIIRKLCHGDARTVRVNKNIVASGFIKLADTLVYLLLVPLTLGYLNAYEYGIWLTLNSMLTWINSFDVGLGNGLRNKLAIALAEGNRSSARIYVSTTFYMLVFIIGVIYVLLAVFVNYIDWYSLLNVSKDYIGNIGEIIQISLLFFCVNFVMKSIGNVYQALQLPAFNYLISFSGHFLSLVIILIFSKLVIPGSLFWVATIYSAAPPLVYLLAYPITFKRLYPYLSPTYKLFRKDYLKELLSLSVIFFILQIASIILFALSNLLISNMFGPNLVTPYNIAYRYFSLVPMAFNMLITPMWTAATDAYAKGDYDWIRRSNRTVLLFLFAFLNILILMVVISGFVYRIWIGETIEIPRTLSVFMAIYIMIIIWSLSYSYFLNGIGKLHIQMICTITAALLFYPLCHYCGCLMGIQGIVLGMCIINLPGAIINTIQFNLVIRHKAKGIWNK